MRKASRLFLISVITAAPALALPPPVHTPQALLDTGKPVTSIPIADSIQGFEPLDNEHVRVSLADRQQYLVTLNRQCVGLRWAQHIGVSTSDNTIWAGFDTLTADGHSCQIREIHRLPDVEAGLIH